MINDPVNLHKKPKLFKIYLSIMATLAVLLLATILVLLTYGGIKLSKESKTLSTKVNNFNSQVNKINTNLQNINNQLQQTKTTTLPSLPSGL